MQPVVFSHGLTANRLFYSCWFREMASCGYFVIALTHNDGSADFSPQAGPYDKSVHMYDYDPMNKKIKQREWELK